MFVYRGYNLVFKTRLYELNINKYEVAYNDSCILDEIYIKKRRESVKISRNLKEKHQINCKKDRKFI